MVGSIRYCDGKGGAKANAVFCALNADPVVSIAVHVRPHRWRLTGLLSHRLNSAQYGNPAANESERKIMAKKNTLSIISDRKKKSSGYLKNQRSAGKHDVELGRRLRLRRVEQEMSQSQLGEKLGVTFQQVQKYEKGVNRIGAARLQQIATALDVPVTFFFDDADAGKRGNESKREVESLLFLDSSFSLRLLRAYSAVKSQAVQRQFVSLIESIAANE